MARPYSELTDKQKAAVDQLRAASGGEVLLAGITGSQLVNAGFAEHVEKPTIPVSRGRGAYRLKSGV